MNTYRPDAGEIELKQTGPNSRMRFRIEDQPDFDRKLQGSLYHCPDLTTWGVFYQKKDEDCYKKFVDALKQCIQSLGVKNVAPPKAFCVATDRFQDWYQQMEGCFNAVGGNVHCLVSILPARGPKKSPLYDDVKRLLLEKCPVPS